jgi:UDP-N-acetylglucosamine 2-epimerase (non-hydrolysing)
MPVKILCVAGARPNFMKIAPILRALAKHQALSTTLVHTGQHYDDALSKVFFEDLRLRKPDILLAVGSGSHSAQTADIMHTFEPVLRAQMPQAVLVVGDVNSTLACGLVASKFNVDTPFESSFGRRSRPLVLHVEAGLRSNDCDMPEEINRKLTDALSDLLFVSEPSGATNLVREGIDPSRIHFVGNVMIDSLIDARAHADASTILSRLGITPHAFGLVTLHRPSNVDNVIALTALLETLDGIARTLPLVFAVHPRTRARIAAAGVTLNEGRWRVTDPLGYLDFLKLMASARVVLTDSGGIQEETTVLGIRCITLRDTTERPITIEEGTNVLAGTSREGILGAFDKSMAALATVPARAPQLWDGHAAERIAEIVRAVLVP